MSLTPAAVIPHVITLLHKHYVFPEVSAELDGILSSALRDGRYDTTDQQQFAELVTTDLQSVNGDLHLRLKHSHAELEDTHDDEATQLRMFAEWSDLTCGGVAGAQRLPGNVGLLKIAPLLFPPSAAGPQVIAAMNLLASTDALLLDLRECLGGSPQMVSLVYSYLADDEPVQLSAIAPRAVEKFTQLWTAYVPGPRFGGKKPVWVLISEKTFSGGEALSFDLQENRRAAVVGERSRGGAHPREGFRVDAHLEVTIPTARSVSPISGGNWEGTGVTPDVPTTAENAQAEAYRRALSAVLELGNQGQRRQIAEEAAAALEGATVAVPTL